MFRRIVNESSWTVVCELIDAYNSDMSDDDFGVLLKECRSTAPKLVRYLLRRIKKQEFNEELPNNQ